MSEPCEPCELMGLASPAIAATGWDQTPVCDWHLTHSWSSAPERVGKGSWRLRFRYWFWTVCGYFAGLLALAAVMEEPTDYAKATFHLLATVAFFYNRSLVPPHHQEAPHR